MIRRRKTPLKNIIENKIREYSRRITASSRALPSFIIIGTARGGTTSLFNYLLMHPSISAPVKKEVAYFCTHYHKGLNWYKLHFPKRSELTAHGAITGEASPYYLSHPLAPERIRKDLPHVKLIVLLRDPVERAFSSYKNIKKIGLENLTFEQAVRMESDRVRGEKEKILKEKNYYSRSHQHHSYLGRGLYHDEIRLWLENFPREQMLIINSEELYRNPGKIYQQCISFLGLKEHQPQGFKIFNETSAADQMDPELRRELYSFFRDHNENLFELIGQRFNWNEKS